MRYLLARYDIAIVCAWNDLHPPRYDNGKHTCPTNFFMEGHLDEIDLTVARIVTFFLCVLGFVNIKWTCRLYNNGQS